MFLYARILVGGLLLVGNLISPSTLAADYSGYQYVVDRYHPDASDDNQGHYESSGPLTDLEGRNYSLGNGQGPFLTIQAMVNRMRAGDKGCVRSVGNRNIRGWQPYFEDYRQRGHVWGGVTFISPSTGSPGQPIVVEGCPGERPIIDQQYRTASLNSDGSSDPIAQQKPLTGFYLGNASYVTIRGFEVRRTSASAIMTGSASITQNDGIIIENNIIYNVRGGDNVAGIRLDFADDCEVRNNLIYNIFDSRRSQPVEANVIYNLQARTEDELLVEEQKLNWGSTFNTGIHGFQPGNTLIENNTIYNVGKGIFTKAADSDGKNAHHIRNNLIFNAADTAIIFSQQGAGGPAHFNAEIHNNLILAARAGISLDSPSSSQQSAGIKIYNNSFDYVPILLSFKGIMGIEVYNNIFSNTRPSRLVEEWARRLTEAGVGTTLPNITERSVPSAKTLDIKYVKNSADPDGDGRNQSVTIEDCLVAQGNDSSTICYDHKNGIDYFDNNIYYNYATNWTLENDSISPLLPERRYSSLESWRTADDSHPVFAGLSKHSSCASQEALDCVSIEINEAPFSYSHPEIFVDSGKAIDSFVFRPMETVTFRPLSLIPGRNSGDVIGASNIENIGSNINKPALPLIPKIVN